MGGRRVRVSQEADHGKPEDRHEQTRGISKALGARKGVSLRRLSPSEQAAGYRSTGVPEYRSEGHARKDKN